MELQTFTRLSWHEAPSNFRPPSPDPLRDTDVRAAHRRGDGARAFSIGMRGSTEVTGEELAALCNAGQRADRR